jgi:hypothetical protein
MAHLSMGRCMHSIALHNIFHLRHLDNLLQYTYKLSATSYLSHNLLSTNRPIPRSLIRASLDARTEMRHWITRLRALYDQDQLIKASSTGVLSRM